MNAYQESMTNERLTWEAEAKAEVEYSEKTGLAKN